MWRKLKNFFNDQWQQISHKQRYFIVGLIIFLILTPVLVFALDAVTTAILKILTGIISLLVSFFGKLLAVVLHVLIYVAQYNNFIKEQVVVEGWKVVRDVCNMFFVLGLLIIAFGTVLRLQNYQAKSLLRSFIFGAIFVNFSKTICGLILDFAQIIMLTFVNGFKDVGAGNLTEMLGLTALFDVVVNNSNTDAVEGIGIFISYLLALVYIIVALVVILTMTIMLIQRAVMIWIYVILSPFPYLLSALPKAGKLGQAGGRWWSDFTGLVITGPMLAFFIWLSFFTASGSGVSEKPDIQLTGRDTAVADPNKQADLTTDINAGVTQSGTASAIIKFLVSIGLLWGGMMLTKETSSLLGNVVGAGMSNLKNAGNKVKKIGTNMATGAAKNTAKWAGRNALKGVGGLTYAASKNSNSKVGQSLQKIGKAGQTWGQELTEERKKEKTKKRLNTLKKIGLGVGDKTMGAFKEVADDDVVKTVGKTVKGAKTFAVGTALTAMTGGLGLVAPVATGILGGMGVMASGAAGLAQSPFNKLIGRGIKKMIGGTTVPAYEDAYDKRHKKVSEAAEIMKSDRSTADKKRDEIKKTAEKNFKEGKIDKEDYNYEMNRADVNHAGEVKTAKNKYNVAKKAATKTMHEEFADIELNQLNHKNDKINRTNEERERKGKKPINLKSLKKNEEEIDKINKDKAEYGKNLGMSKAAAWLAVGTGVKNLGQGIEDYHPFQLSSDAAKLHLKDSQVAKGDVEDMAKITNPADLAGRLSPKYFSGGLKNLDNKHVKFWQALTDTSDANSQPAINNITSAIGHLDPSKDKDKNIIESIMKGLSTFEKSGGNVALLSNLKTALDNKSTKQYSEYLSDAKSVKLRQTDKSAINGEGDGSLRVNSFASGKHKTNIIGADFDKLSSLGDLTPDINTGEVVGANIAPEKMAAVASELTGLIDGELAELQQQGASMINEPLDSLEQKISQLRSQRTSALQSGNLEEASSAMEELEPLSRVRDLRVAKERLADPANLNNLSLKNTGVSLASARESQTTNMHEALHGFGLDNENLTEGVAKQMAGGSYSVDDAAAVAQNIKDIMAQKNISQEQITPEDIAQAISGIQPASQAEQIIAKEGGETIINNEETTINLSGNEANKKISELSENIKQRQRLEDFRYFRGLNEDKKDRRRAENIEKSVKQPNKQ